MSKLLCIDPSSTRTGYAVFELPAPAALLDAGYLTPSPRNIPAIERIFAMQNDLRELIHEVKPRRMVIEITSGHVGRRHQGHGAGLAVYGMAVGVLLAECRAATVINVNVPVTTVEENDWTLGVPKKRRQVQVAMMFPQYREAMSRDDGADVADAIGLGLWWFDRGRLRTEVA